MTTKKIKDMIQYAIESDQIDADAETIYHLLLTPMDDNEQEWEQAIDDALDAYHESLD